MSDAWVLAIDLGTGGPKTAAVSLGGELLAHDTRSVATHFTPDGGVTQDPEAWWRGISDGVASVLRAGVSPAALIGVGITGQWGSTVPVDASGAAVGECLLWCDTRGREYSRRAIGGRVSVMGYAPVNLMQWVRLTGGAPSPHGADPLGHELYLRNRAPDIYARAATLMEPLDYIGMRFAGRRAATPASMVLSWLTDNRRGTRSAYAPALIRRSGRDPARLPELIPTGSVLGTVVPHVADELDLPSGIPVVAGIPDLHTAFVGSGAVRAYQAHVTIGTTAWISCEVPFKRTDPFRQMASIPGLREGAYLVANNHETAGLCLQWLRDSIIAPADGLAAGERDLDYDALTSLAATAPVGSRGVVFTPWLNGERTPVEDRSLRAAFLNVSMATDRACLVRAVLEGVALNARWLHDAVEKFVRRKLPVLRILGGGATSDLWCQIHADVLNRPVERVAQPMHANVRGAGLFAAMALGRLSLDDVGTLVPVAARFEPEPSARLVYEPMYGEFRRLYGRLKGFYAQMNRDT